MRCARAVWKALVVAAAVAVAVAGGAAADARHARGDSNGPSLVLCAKAVADHMDIPVVNGRDGDVPDLTGLRGVDLATTRDHVRMLYKAAAVFSAADYPACRHVDRVHLIDENSPAAGRLPPGVTPRGASSSSEPAGIPARWVRAPQRFIGSRWMSAARSP